MAIDQTIDGYLLTIDPQAMEKVDLCHDGCDLFRTAKQRAGEKKAVVGVICLKDESGVVKVSVDDQKKNLGGVYGKDDEW